MIRDPISRAVSEARFRHIPCSTPALDRYLRRQLARIQKGAVAFDDCHWIPQFEYVTNIEGVMDPTTHIICFEEFPATLGRIFGHPFDVHKKNRHCGARLSPPTVALIRDVYNDDFVLRRRYCRGFAASPSEHEVPVDPPPSKAQRQGTDQKPGQPSGPKQKAKKKKKGAVKLQTVAQNPPKKEEEEKKKVKLTMAEQLAAAIKKMEKKG